MSRSETRPLTVMKTVMSSSPAGAGDQIDERIEVADQRHGSLVEGDALAEDRQPAADEFERADRLHVGDRPGQANRAAELRRRARVRE